MKLLYEVRHPYGDCRRGLQPPVRADQSSIWFDALRSPAGSSYRGPNSSTERLGRLLSCQNVERNLKLFQQGELACEVHTQPQRWSSCHQRNDIKEKRFSFQASLQAK